MDQPQNKSKRLIEIVLVIFILIGFGLIMTDLVSNVVYEVNSANQMEAAVQEVTPTPKPTLTLEEREEMFNRPVNEAGN